MRKPATLFFVIAVYALMGVGVATADDDDSRKRGQKPDSIITCQGDSEGNSVYLVRFRGAPASVDMDQCSTFPGPIRECSPCIRSMEKQGCKVIDVIVTNGSTASQAGGPVAVRPEDPRATFLLSCEKP